MEITKVELNIFKQDVEEHQTLKPILLDLINKDGSPEYREGYKTDYHSDYEIGDSPPKYKKLFVDRIVSKYNYEISNYLGVLNLKKDIGDIWYQQYLKDSIHGWHVHSENYTGVYYLEYPVNAPPTELWDNSLKIPEVSEGDVVMFPAMTPHRAPMVKNDIRKTIVSFNFNVIELNTKRLKEFKKIVNST